MGELQGNLALRLAVQLAEDDGVSVAEILDRGMHDLKLRVALRWLKQEERQQNGIG